MTAVTVTKQRIKPDSRHPVLLGPLLRYLQQPTEHPQNVFTHWVSRYEHRISSRWRDCYAKWRDEHRSSPGKQDGSNGFLGSFSGTTSGLPQLAVNFAASRLDGLDASNSHLH
jgi:hypothetical protein